jgi:putative DNA primase/helicase
MIIAYGTGANGKTTLLGTLRELLGDYAREADAESFMDKKNQGIREDIADLDGARFVTASETSDGKRLSEALVKKMTGGERLRARRLYENGYEFVPHFKPWLATNHKPSIQGTEHAIWRRIKLLPFAVTITDDQKDPDLPEKLKAEYPGILAWAVRGCLDWQRHGLTAPAAVVEATTQYRESMDTVAAWLDDACELGPTWTAKAGDLHASYKKWCEVNGERWLSPRKLGERLAEKGFEPFKGTGGVRTWLGVKLQHVPGQPTLSGASGVSGVTSTKEASRNSENENSMNLTPLAPLTPPTEQQTFIGDEDDDEPDF